MRVSECMRRIEVVNALLVKGKEVDGSGDIKLVEN